MNVAKGVNFEELARSTDEFNAAQLRAVAVEAGMIALREGANEIHHEHFLSGILEVQSKKKNDREWLGYTLEWHLELTDDLVDLMFYLISALFFFFLLFVICAVYVEFYFA